MLELLIGMLLFTNYVCNWCLNISIMLCNMDNMVVVSVTQ